MKKLKFTKVLKTRAGQLCKKLLTYLQSYKYCDILHGHLMSCGKIKHSCASEAAIIQILFDNVDEQITDVEKPFTC